MFTAIYWHRFLCHQNLKTNKNDCSGLYWIHMGYIEYLGYTEYMSYIESGHIMISEQLFTIAEQILP